MANPFFDDFMKVVDEMKAQPVVSVDLLVNASSILAAWQQAGGDHVASIPKTDPKQVAAERAALEEKLAGLKTD